MFVLKLFVVHLGFEGAHGVGSETVPRWHKINFRTKNSTKPKGTGVYVEGELYMKYSTVLCVVGRWPTNE
jgi:hypothetical protein